MPETNDLDALFPPEITVHAGGEDFTLTAFKAKNLRPYLAISRRMNEKATQLGRDLVEGHAAVQRYLKAKDTWLKTGKGKKPDAPDLGGVPFDLAAIPVFDADKIPLDLLHERCYEEYLDLVIAATGKPAAWVEDLDIDELVDLAGIVNALNVQRYATKK